MNMERLFNSPLEEGYVSIDGLNYNVTVDVIFAPLQCRTPCSKFGWLQKLFCCFWLRRKKQGKKLQNKKKSYKDLGVF